MNIKFIARACNTLYQAHCAVLGMNVPDWEHLPQAERDQAIEEVQYHIDNPKAGSEGWHNRWFARKTKEGWTVGKYDAEAKTQPAMVPYDKLDDDYKIDDAIMIALIHILQGL